MAINLDNCCDCAACRDGFSRVVEQVLVIVQVTGTVSDAIDAAWAVAMAVDFDSPPIAFYEPIDTNIDGTGGTCITYVSYLTPNWYSGGCGGYNSLSVTVGGVSHMAGPSGGIYLYAGNAYVYAWRSRICGVSSTCISTRRCDSLWGCDPADAVSDCSAQTSSGSYIIIPRAGFDPHGVTINTNGNASSYFDTAWIDFTCQDCTCP